MTRFSKTLVILGAAAMASTPVVASASGSTLPVMLMGGPDQEDSTLLVIGGVAIVGTAIALLAKGNSKSK